MAACVCAFILTLYALCGSAAGSGVLSAPTNVRLTSHNMDLVLRWDPPEGAAGDLNYTAEYRSSAVPYKAVCMNISALQCDFTSPFISPYGNYRGRVQVHRGAESSGWVESNKMTLDRDTSIGPPNVTILRIGTSLEVSITDPGFKTSSLRAVYYSATYNITYWNSSQKQEAKTLSDLQQNRVVLEDLEPMCEYCVQVQINTNQNTRPSEFSDIVCESTADKDAVPWVAAVVTVVVMVVLVALVVVMVVYWNRISQFLCPEIVLPPHFKESLLPPPKSSVYLASPPSEEVCDRVSIIADNRTKTEDEGRPLEEGRSSK